MNLFSACNSGARALPQSLPAAEAQEPPTGSLTAEKGQVTPRAHPWPPAGLGESEPGPQAASHPWERGTGLQAGKAGALTDPGLRKLKRSCTGGEFELLTQTTAAVGKVDEARGCLQLTPRKPWTTAQASPHSLSADSQGSRGKAQMYTLTEIHPTVPEAPPPRPAPPCPALPKTLALRRPRWLSKGVGPRGCPRRSVQPPGPPHVLTSQDTPTLPRDTGTHQGGAWVLPQPQEARGHDWLSASLCQVRAPGTAQLPPHPPEQAPGNPVQPDLV